jgi:hypothetical protein
MASTLKSGFQISRRGRLLLLVLATPAPLRAWIEWKRGREPMTWAAMAAPLAWGAATLAVLRFVPAPGAVLNCSDR